MEYYKIISSEVPVEVRNLATNELIQISAIQLSGFRPIIEDEILAEKEGFNVVSSYEIINGEVHRTYRYEEIIEQDNMEV